jgi:hypothetical protein
MNDSQPVDLRGRIQSRRLPRCETIIVKGDGIENLCTRRPETGQRALKRQPPRLCATELFARISWSRESSAAILEMEALATL